jgi:hypothetical protein
MFEMRRREFITLLGGAAAWLLPARAQPAAMPMIGLLSSLAPTDLGLVMPGFHQGLGIHDRFPQIIPRSQLLGHGGFDRRRLSSASGSANVLPANAQLGDGDRERNAQTSPADDPSKAVCDSDTHVVAQENGPQAHGEMANDEQRGEGIMGDESNVPRIMQ